jgi:hypothetical protein
LSTIRRGVPNGGRSYEGTTFDRTTDKFDARSNLAFAREPSKLKSEINDSKNMTIDDHGMRYSDQYTFLLSQQTKKVSIREGSKFAERMLIACIEQIKSVCKNVQEAVEKSALFRCYISYTYFHRNCKNFWNNDTDVNFIKFIRQAADSKKPNDTKVLCTTIR